MSETIGGKTLEEWYGYLHDDQRAGGGPPLRERFSEYTAAVRKECEDNAVEGMNSGQVLVLQKQLSEAETRPCPTCKGLADGENCDASGQTIICPNPECVDGSIPRDLAIALEVADQVAEYETMGVTRAKVIGWSRAKYGEKKPQTKED